jgi:hypothetical protein
MAECLHFNTIQHAFRDGTVRKLCLSCNAMLDETVKPMGNVKCLCGLTGSKEFDWLCEACYNMLPLEAKVAGYYKQYYVIEGDHEDGYTVFSQNFTPSMAATTNSDFIPGKGISVIGAQKCCDMWNLNYSHGATRYYMNKENAEVQAQKLNAGKLKKPLVPVAILPKKEPMKHGEIRKLPRGLQTPMHAEQWAVMGTGKAPYVISHRKNHPSVDQRWQCSCPSWTQHTPRADCKHIVAVKQKEGMLVEKTAALLPPDKQKLFEEFLKQQAEAGTPALKSIGVKPLNFADKGRRFR